MERIAYVVIDERGRPILASFDEVKARAAAAKPGHRVIEEVVDPPKVALPHMVRLGHLTLLCLAIADETSETLFYLAVSGPESEGRQGSVLCASLDKDVAMAKVGCRNELRKISVVPSVIASIARADIGPVGVLCLEATNERDCERARRAGIRAYYRVASPIF